jgi:hypothetical protein
MNYLPTFEVKKLIIYKVTPILKLLMSSILIIHIVLLSYLLLPFA